MLKQELKRKIELKELDSIKEKRNICFELSYVNRGDVIRYVKRFMHKRNVEQYLKNPDVTKIKLYVCEVVPYERTDE